MLYSIKVDERIIDYKNKLNYLISMRQKKQHVATSDEIIVLAKEGDQEAIDIVIADNKGLIGKYISKYKHLNNLTHDDLYQVGVIGMIEAINHYEPGRGAFSNCATLWIKAIVYRYVLTHDSTIQKPTNFRRLDMEHDDAIFSPVSINMSNPASDNESEDYESTIVDTDDSLNFNFDNYAIKEAIEKIENPLHKKIVKMYYYQDMQFDQIEEKTGLERHIIGSILHRTRENLRKYLTT